MDEALVVKHLLHSLVIVAIVGFHTLSATNTTCAEDQIPCNETVPCIPRGSSEAEIKECREMRVNVPPPCPSNVTCKLLVGNDTGDAVCLEESKVCDGTIDCTEGKDERLQDCCPNKCSKCDLKRQSFVCHPSALPEIPLPAKTIVASGGGNLDVDSLCKKKRNQLEYLDISQTELSNIDCLSKTIAGEIVFPKLVDLDISHNNITEIPDLHLPVLTKIRVDNNPLKMMHFFKEDLTVSMRNAEISRMHWIRNNNTMYAHAPLTFQTDYVPGDPDPMGSPVDCRVTNIDLRYNNLVYFDTLGHCQEVKHLDISHNKISTLDFDSFNGFRTITDLDLSFNELTDIETPYFYGLTHLYSLNLEYNKLVRLSPEAFYDLKKLVILRLNNNKLRTMPWPVFSRLESLEYLYLQRNNLVELHVRIFQRIKNLRYLDLMNNNLTILGDRTFMSLGKTTYLDLRGNEIQAYAQMFSGLGVLKRLKVHSFTLCCARPASVTKENCEAPVDIFSSCTNLINQGFLGIGIWFTMVLSIFGNIVAMVMRIRQDTWIREMRDIYVTSLCLSDMFMGIYLFIIGYTDMSSRGDYAFYHQIWTKSRLCNIAGVLVTASSEASVLFILAITLDRYYVFRYPFSTNEHKRTIALVSVVLVIVFSTVVAVIPFFFSDFFGGNFYTRSSVCISLPLTPTTLTYSGWEYSVGLFIAFNLLVYFIVVSGQIFIFKEIRKSGLQNDKKREREIAVAKSLSAVVISDTLCWIPIAIVGFFALTGFDVTNDVYAYIIVFVMPINSAINPFLYTFMALRRQRARKNNPKTAEEKSRKLKIAEIRPHAVPCCGIRKDDPRGCMIIITDPEISDDSEIDVIFSDGEGWTKKSDEVQVLYQIIRCSVPPYKEELRVPSEVKVHLYMRKTCVRTPAVTVRLVPSRGVTDGLPAPESTPRLHDAPPVLDPPPDAPDLREENYACATLDVRDNNATADQDEESNSAAEESEQTKNDTDSCAELDEKHDRACVNTVSKEEDACAVTNIKEIGTEIEKITVHM